MRNVYCVGVGITKYGNLESSAPELASSAAVEALTDANINPGDVDGMFLANCQGAYGGTQLHMSPLVATDLGMPNIPSVRVENACASGGCAFRLGYMSVAGGFNDVALVVGTESVSAMPTARSTETFAFGGDSEYEAKSGISFPGFYALMARAHMEKHGTTREQLAAIAVKNHLNGTRNPKAHFRKELDKQRVLNSFIVTDPLSLFDCSPFSDGAAAVLLVPENMIGRFENPIRVAGSGQASTPNALHDRQDLTTITGTSVAAEKACRQAEVKVKDLSFAEVHDCFTIAEVIALEDIGVYKKGQAALASEAGETAIEGIFPVNPSGGLKAKGHPVAATGVGQIVELVEQLRNQAGDRQVKNAKTGLAHNVGATGATVVVHILSNE